jgi:hypothetical protein
MLERRSRLLSGRDHLFGLGRNRSAAICCHRTLLHHEQGPLPNPLRAEAESEAYVFPERVVGPETAPSAPLDS